MTTRVLLAGALLVVAASCTTGDGDAQTPVATGVPTDTATMRTLVDELVASLDDVSAGAGRSAQLRLCIRLRAADQSLREPATKAMKVLAGRLGAAGLDLLAGAARDCSLEPEAAKSALRRLAAML